MTEQELLRSHEMRIEKLAEGLTLKRAVTAVVVACEVACMIAEKSNHTSQFLMLAGLHGVAVDVMKVIEKETEYSDWNPKGPITDD